MTRIKIYLFWGLLVSIFLGGCGAQSNSGQNMPRELPDNSWELEGFSISIQGVEVQTGELIVFQGEAALPEDQCVYTRLLMDDAPVDWWPVGKCFPVTGQAWRFSVSLGDNGAPEALETGVQYQLKIWWPGAPEQVADEFPFDLSPVPYKE